MLQKALMVGGEVAMLCCIHASRFFINTTLQLTLITKSVIECMNMRIRSWMVKNGRFSNAYYTQIRMELEDSLRLFWKLLSCRVR